MRTAYGYVRVSSEDQADSGLGLEAQRQRFRAFCELKGLHLAGILGDPCVSGAKPFPRVLAAPGCYRWHDVGNACKNRGLPLAVRDHPAFPHHRRERLQALQLDPQLSHRERSLLKLFAVKRDLGLASCECAVPSSIATAGWLGPSGASEQVLRASSLFVWCY